MSRPIPSPLMILAALLLVAASASAARADSFALNATTQLSFTCFQSTPCSVSDHSVTFGTGADTTTFTFSGSVLNATIGNAATTLVLGSIQTSVTGTGFVSPGNPNNILGTLRITLTQNSPTAGSSTIDPFLVVGPGGYSLLFGEGVGTHRAFTTGNSNYPFIVYTFNLDNPPSRLNLPAGTTTDITAQVVATPEPATLLLLATGLAGAALRARRRAKA